MKNFDFKDFGYGYSLVQIEEEGLFQRLGLTMIDHMTTLEKLTLYSQERDKLRQEFDLITSRQPIDPDSVSEDIPKKGRIELQESCDLNMIIKDEDIPAATEKLLAAGWTNAFIPFGP